jgi:hypothetical protein
MTEKTNEKNLDAMNARIAESREEIAALAAGLKELVERKTDTSSVDGSLWHDGPSNGGNRSGAWRSFRHSLDEVSSRGGKVAKGVADEIERHPLMGGLAAFGLGFGIATLLYRRSKNGSGR